jgi:sulfite reductase (NADPH) hemoprotein beta-component
MYKYDTYDQAMVDARVEEFRDQVQRRLSGELNEDQFRPLRLMNGLYLQLHAYMLRVAIPYGTLSAKQMRMLAHIARKYDKGYGHFTTRQNIQYNWIKLDDDARHAGRSGQRRDARDPDVRQLHPQHQFADQWAGVAADEIEDPRPWAELLRQWSSLHPEFCYLPRKFKIASSAAEADRAAMRLHDIGIRMVKKNDKGETGAGARRRRHGPHPDARAAGLQSVRAEDRCSPMPKRACASTTATAAATTSTRRASRSCCTS